MATTNTLANSYLDGIDKAADDIAAFQKKLAGQAHEPFKVLLEAQADIGLELAKGSTAVARELVA